MYGISRRKLGYSKPEAFIEPSSVYPIYSDSNDVLSSCGAEQIILHTASLPKLQVVKKEGNYFALNKAQLDLCKKLQKEGKCTKVKVDIVPLSQVPQIIRAMMTVPQPKPDTTSQTSSTCSSKQTRTSTKGYERLGQSEATENSQCSNEPKDKNPMKQPMESELEETGSESSEYGDSDYDWSESGSERSTCASTGTDEEKSTDNEKESLL